MGFLDERVLATLRDGKPKSLTEIQSQVGFSHNTLHQHLTRLVEKDLVLREKDPARVFGRPKYVYHLLSKAIKQVNAALEDLGVELVTVPFSRLRHVCRFEKGGWCKMKKASYSPQICP